MECIEIRLAEWDEAGPASSQSLRGVSFDEHPEGRAAAVRLAKEGRLDVIELRDGILVRSNSWVGTVRLGPLRVSIRPKIPGRQLLQLLRYTYGLRDLGLQAVDEAQLDRGEFQDIVIHQLAEEAGELVHRGLQRASVPRHEWRSDPRGRIDFAGLARSGHPGETRLPCDHHDRSADTPLNRVLRAGLLLAANLARDPGLASRVRHLAGLLEGEVGALRLEARVLEDVRRKMDRLTRAYEPALRLIGVLLQDAGPSLEGGGSTLPLDGFLFDMNVFFESLLDRFLSENLPGCRVHLQHRLTDMFTWQNEGANRRRRPSPRPDYVVVQPGGSLAVLDAKYRDLSRDLPREMFYQLTMYSMCHGAGNLATILYPSMAVGGRDDRLRIQDPVSRDHLATVVLRPVPLPTLAALLVEGTGGRATATARYELARRLAFGAA